MKVALVRQGLLDFLVALRGGMLLSGAAVDSWGRFFRGFRRAPLAGRSLLRAGRSLFRARRSLLRGGGALLGLRGRIRADRRACTQSRAQDREYWTSVGQLLLRQRTA